MVVIGRPPLDKITRILLVRLKCGRVRAAQTQEFCLFDISSEPKTRKIDIEATSIQRGDGPQVEEVSKTTSAAFG